MARGQRTEKRTISSTTPKKKPPFPLSTYFDVCFSPVSRIVGSISRVKQTSLPSLKIIFSSYQSHRQKKKKMNQSNCLFFSFVGNIILKSDNPRGCYTHEIVNASHKKGPPLTTCTEFMLFLFLPLFSCMNNPSNDPQTVLYGWALTISHSISF